MQQPPIELRDSTGRLYGKIVAGTLEIKRGDRIVRFNLENGKEVKKSRRDLDKAQETR